VLTGIIGGLLAQGVPAADAACAGVFVHGRAADLATAALGSQLLLAGDLPDAIARAIESLSPSR
jgi:NAD(P)H-hydrate epimerase